MYQFLQLHIVNLADNNQLCKGILRNGYHIALLLYYSFLFLFWCRMLLSGIHLNNGIFLLRKFLFY